MTFRLPEPTGWFVDSTYATMNSNITKHHAVNGEPVEPLYTAQALRDLLEQAALKVESQWYSNEDAVRKAVVEIRKMIGEIT